jgi:Ca2+-binding RTX toxin-like protein
MRGATIVRQFRLRHCLMLVACGVALAGVAPATAAAESCVYNSGTKSVTATITPGSQATLKVSAAGQLLFGLVPAPCGGATSTNTDSVSVAGAPGSTEKLTLDQSESFFGPGASSESNIPEIELATNLGDWEDVLAIIGTPGNDVIAPGQNGVAIDSDGDLDITVNPGIFHVEISALGGDDFVNGRGQGGAGLHFLGPLVIDGGPGNDEIVGSTDPDKLYGREGNDEINAQDGADLLDGGSGNDFLTASEGNDTIVGGPGADSLSGGYGDDLLDGDDGEADTSFNGGPGTDTLYYDLGIDPSSSAVETKIADPGPPPPPPPPPPPGGACTYNAASKTATASLSSAGATLTVVGGEIRFGATPIACAGATTTNTDTIKVVGGAGSTETLIVDQSGGAFAPGATAETTGLSEIELEINLGDASDQVTVVGSAANDVLAMGAKGLAMNSDSDVDATFTPLPSSIELQGGGGKNVLTARGGYGSGTVFLGSVTLRAGNLGDDMTGSNLADLIVGGNGDDVVNGYSGNDTIQGGGGNDKLNGADGNDEITGGAGADTLSGGNNDDTLRANDGQADASINGGSGVDTAYYDAAVDPGPSAVENKIAT